MDFIDILKNRRACHHFIPNKTIPKKDMEELVEMATLAPSGYNAQPWEFIVIQKKENLKKLQQIAFKQSHIASASAVVVVLGDTEIGRHHQTIMKDWMDHGYCAQEDLPDLKNALTKNRPQQKKEFMAIRNAMLTAMTFIYAAQEKGYATCPMMGFSHKDLIPFLNIPEDRVVALMIAIGYEDKGKEQKQLPRKKAEELIHWERFGENLKR